MCNRHPVKPYWGNAKKIAKKGHSKLLDAAINACKDDNPAMALGLLLILRAKRKASREAVGGAQ